MTDYPTRAEIDAARDTLVYLHSHVDKSTLLALIAREALWDAARILDALDDIPGLHAPQPEPEPQPTATQVLREACHATDHGTPERGITLAAMHYAEAHPEWFAEPRCWHGLTAALYAAHVAASDSGNVTASLALATAHSLTESNPDLFGGAA